MNDGKRAALEVAEAARDNAHEGSGFGSNLFMGSYTPNAMFPFPKQSAEDKEIGDKLVKQVCDYLYKNLFLHFSEFNCSISKEEISFRAKGKKNKKIYKRFHFDNTYLKA